MELKGQIKVFGIADIIQLISQQQKTGILRIDKEGGEKAQISFLKGDITGAKPSQYKTSCPLGEMLVNSKLLSPENLKIALKEQKKTFEYLLVSPEEADFQAGKISVTSPVGKGLLGNKKGDKVNIKVPAGLLEFEILELM